MQVLLKNEQGAKADPSIAGADGLTPLHLAVYANEPECVGTLLKSGALPNATDTHGKTPIHEAAFG